MQLKACFSLLMISLITQAHASEVNLNGLVKPHFDAIEPQLEAALEEDIVFKQTRFPVSDSIEEAFVYGEQVGVVGLFGHSIARLREAGWISNLSNNPALVQAAKLMPSALVNEVTFDDGVYALGKFFICTVIPIVDLDQYRELGYERQDLPSTWKGLYEQMLAIAESGEKGFYLPNWFDGPSGLPAGFSVEMENRGGHLINPDTGGLAMNAYSGPAHDILIDWRRIFQSGAVNTRVLTMNHLEFLEAFMNTDFLFTTHQSSEFIRAKRDKLNQHKLSLLPGREQPWGIIGSLYFSASDQPGETAEQQRQKQSLLLHYTRGAGTTKDLAAQHAFDMLGVFPAFLDLLNSDKLQGELMRRLHFPEDAKGLMQLVDNADGDRILGRVVWRHEFINYLHQQLSNYLADDSIEPQTVIKNLNQKILSLRQQYGF